MRTTSFDGCLGRAGASATVVDKRNELRELFPDNHFDLTIFYASLEHLTYKEKNRHHFWLSDCPQRYHLGDAAHGMLAVIRVVSGATPHWTEITAQLYKNNAKHIVTVKDLRQRKRQKSLRTFNWTSTSLS